jgi:predicted DNA-binding transcriptional regulator YafY
MRITPAHARRLFYVMETYIRHAHGVTDSEIALLFKVSRMTAYRYRRELARYHVYEASPGRYSMQPTEAMILFAHAVLARETHERGNPHRRRA